jgi:thioredoxin reductase (NADPH)
MIETDAVVIGAGPVGLYQVFQLGLQEVRAHLIDALPYPGGQCAELYADKPIYDIPGLPVCSGRELIERLLQQIQPFQVPMHLGQQVARLERLPDGRWHVGSSSGTEWCARVVVIAAGVGAFVPRAVALPELATWAEGPTPQVCYHRPDPTRLCGQRVVVMGGEDAALETALELLRHGQCARVTLLHRIDRFRAEARLEQAVREAIATGALDWVEGQPVGLATEPTPAGQRLSALHLATPESPDQPVRLPLDLLLPRLGLSPRLGPVADWGLAMARKQLAVDTERFATSAPGVLAVGDVNTYPGKRKLIACGFHEATLAGFAAAALVYPDKRPLLQYTTTSPRLHELLGVSAKA